MAYTNDDRLQVALQADSGVLSVANFTSSTAAQLRGPNSTRTMLTVYNQGPSKLYVLYGEGVPSSSNYSVSLDQNDYLELPFYQGEVRAVFAAAGSIAKVTEL